MNDVKAKSYQCLSIRICFAFFLFWYYLFYLFTYVYFIYFKVY